jgi:hypothetical protein
MPDYTAAFEGNWTGNNTTLWPLIQLAGEKASAGKTLNTQHGQAASYIHYLLLARPDLYVTQGWFTNAKGITFLFGIGGVGLREFTVSWSDENLRELMHAFIYRLYEPGPFADPTYTIKNDAEDGPTYTVHIGGVGGDTAQELRGFTSLYACSPFETRTHVLWQPKEPGVLVNGKRFTVLKDQWCRSGTRFAEHEILSHIHKERKVPGVVEMVYHEVIEIPSSLGELSKPKFREKHRIGLQETGQPLTTIPILQKVLEVIFDVLEGNMISIKHDLQAHIFPVLRYLRFARNVLHRDISKGNVLFVATTTGAAPDGACRVSKAGTATEISPCFIKYLLDERCVRVCGRRTFSEARQDLVRIPTKLQCCSLISTIASIWEASMQRSATPEPLVIYDVCGVWCVVCLTRNITRARPSSLLALFRKDVP